jgi:hypothetical protein
MVGGGGESGGSVFTDAASNSTAYVSGGFGYTIKADPGSPPKYTGKVTSVGAVTCSPSSCPSYVQGGVTTGASPAPCTAPTLPSFQTGGSAFHVPCTGASIDATTSPKYGSIDWTTIATPGAPTVTQSGASGITSYSYKVVAVDGCGKRTLASSSTTITTGYSPLGGLNYNQITWTNTSPAGGYDVLRNGQLIGHTTATLMNDTGQSATSYNNCPTPTDLTINTGSTGTNSVLEVTGTFTMGFCSRVIIGGSGNLELRLGQVSGTVLTMAPSTHFGVLPSDTMFSPASVPANRLIVNVKSNTGSISAAAVSLASNPGGSEGSGGGSFVAAGTYNVPNGLVSIGGSGGEDGGGGFAAGFFGSINANLIYIGGTFHSDTSGASGSTYSNFTNLKSWKDQ